MNILSNYEDSEDLGLNGLEDIRKFIKENYTKLTMLQLTRMLGITPGVIQDVLSDTQLRKVGSRAVASVLIVRDTNDFLQDSKELLKALDG